MPAITLYLPDDVYRLLNEATSHLNRTRSAAACALIRHGYIHLIKLPAIEQQKLREARA